MEKLFHSLTGLEVVFASTIVGIGLLTTPRHQIQAQASVPTVNSVSLNGVLDDTPQLFNLYWDLSFYWSNYFITLNPLSQTDGLYLEGYAILTFVNIKSGAGSDEWFEIWIGMEFSYSDPPYA